MLPVNSFLCVLGVIITIFDSIPGVLGEDDEKECKHITNNINSENINKVYHYVPEGVGNISITEEEFTNKMRTLFSDHKEELLCAVTLSEELTAIPNITCEGAFSEDLQNSLKELKANYSDEAAQNKVLDNVWGSKVGKQMLDLLSNETFNNESNAKTRVKEMWFKYEAATLLMLFPDVFLGYKPQEEFRGITPNTTESNKNQTHIHGVKNNTILCDDAEGKEGEDDYDEYDDFLLDAGPVSWTGNYFRQIEGDLNITKGNARPLVENSSYLASVEEELDGESRNATFVVGTTFIYDFVSFSMCWIYGVKLERCIVPLPVNTTETIVIKNITVESYSIRDDNTTYDMYITCTGFKVNSTGDHAN